MSVSFDRSLLEHTTWMRALARRLVADSHMADDLTQETLVVALRNRPDPGGDLRRWLGTVMGNLFRQMRRSEKRRHDLERRAARTQERTDVLESLAQASVHRELVDVLLSLEDPFRNTLVLRFFEGLPPREVARRLGVPVNTVYSRVRRGLARMRAELDKRNAGERHVWVRAALPIAYSGRFGGIWMIGVMLMKFKITLTVATAAIVVCALFSLWWWYPPFGSDLVSESRDITARSVDEELPERQGLPPFDPASRSAIPAVPEETPNLVTMEGRVVDVNAAPLVGIQLSVHMDRPDLRGNVFTVTSGFDGRFKVETADARGTVSVEDPGYVTVFSGELRPSSTIEPVVVAARLHPLGGYVLDVEGKPLTGARVQIHVGDEFRNRFTQVLEASRLRPSWAISDANGRVSMPLAPAIEGARLLTSLRGYNTDEQPLPALSGDHLQIVLRKAVPRGEVLEGIVLDSDGAAVAGAHVALGRVTMRSDDTGRFWFDLAEAPIATTLTAVAPGSLPGSHTRGEHEPWPDHVTLHLGAPPEFLAGAVVNPDGNPQQGVIVWLIDPTLFGTVDGSPVQIENLLARSMSLAEFRDRLADPPVNFDRQAFREDTPTAFWTFQKTDPMGRFRLEGLLPREYTIAAMRRETLAMARVGPVQSGRRDLEIVLGDVDTYERVAGHVVSRSGRSLPDVRVSYSRSVFSVRDPDDPPGRYSAAYDMQIPGTTTDAAGYFELRSVPMGLKLRFTGDGIIDSSRSLEATDPQNLEVVLASRCHVRVELSGADPQGPDSFALVDPSGQALGLQLIRVGRTEVKMRGQLIDGRSPLLATEDGPAILVLYRGGQELEKHSVYLTPGEPNILRF